MMALTRGVNTSYPCPVCLVPQGEIPNLSVSHPLRTREAMQAIWNQAAGMNATEREELLKSYGLWDIQVIFSCRIIFTDYNN